jgi:hypothetical protein
MLLAALGEPMTTVDDGEGNQVLVLPISQADESRSIRNAKILAQASSATFNVGDLLGL